MTEEKNSIKVGGDNTYDPDLVYKETRTVNKDGATTKVTVVRNPGASNNKRCPDAEPVTAKATPPKVEQSGHEKFAGHHASPAAKEPLSLQTWIGMAAVVIGGILVFLLIMNWKTSDKTPCCLHEYQQGEEHILDLLERMDKSHTVTNSNDKVSSTDQNQVTNIPVVVQASYGEYQPADGDLVLKFIKYFTGPNDKKNFKWILGDSTDGHSKYVLAACQAATFVNSGKWVEYNTLTGDPIITDKDYSNIDMPTISKMTRRMLERPYLAATYKNMDSFEWWVNSSVESVASSVETDYSRAVKQALSNFLEEVQARNIPSVNNVKFFASNNTGGSKSDGSSKANNSAPSKSPALSSLNTKRNHYLSLKYISPIPFGYRASGKLGEDRGDHIHQGQDLARPKGVKPEDFLGKNIVSCSPGKGKITHFGWINGFGNCVKVDIGDAIVIYAHLRSYGPIKLHGTVNQGDVIGTVGSTGESSGPHLHIEFIPKNENFVTPIFGDEPGLISSLGFSHSKKQKPLKGVDFVFVCS